jgi:nesprin-1
MYKDEGYAKVQGVVEMAQFILANTATTGHPAINDSLQKLQDEWSSLAAKMVDTKNQLDESIHKWAGFLEQIHQLRKTVEYLESVLKDVTPFQTTIQEKRSQLETIRVSKSFVSDSVQFLIQVTYMFLICYRILRRRCYAKSSK